MKRATGTTGRLVANCPNCKSWAEGRDPHDGKVMVFTFGGLTHALPSIWLAGAVLGDRQPLSAAFALWVQHCDIENARETVAS